MTTKGFSEDELGRRWDRCLTDTAIKFGGGLVIGAVTSVLFFKRRSWPIILGTGFGLGMGYSNCQRDINGLLPQTSRTKSEKETG